MRSIQAVAADAGLTDDDIQVFGPGIAKVQASGTKSVRAGRLVLVSAINPAPAGEGKTTVSIGLAMGMRRLGKKVMLALREPSLGPIFGLKGGATGGGRAVLLPSDRINLHFTGDMHAVGAANNLLAAIADNALHFRSDLNGVGQLDARQVTWGRAIDMNDRALRQCVIGLGGKSEGMPRESRFDITAASEVMAILALAEDAADLQARLSRIVVGRTSTGEAVTAAHLEAQGAMAVLLRDALQPNLVQTAEGGPAIVHCGPFANIAHGCNSVLGTRLGLALGDYVVTEAGFGFDLGGEKFLNLKCRQAGIWPRVVVVVASLRSLKMHGGVKLKEVAAPNMAALQAGMPNLHKHLQSVAAFGLPAVVALNLHAGDPPDEAAWLIKSLADAGTAAVGIDAFARGGEGATALAELVCGVADKSDAAPPRARYTYGLEDTAEQKAHKVATALYGARDVHFTSQALTALKGFCEMGYGTLPICVAKTPASLSDDASLRGRPQDFTIKVQDVRLSAGAGFLVLLTGDVRTMPGLPRVPAARGIRLDAAGNVEGLG